MPEKSKRRKELFGEERKLLDLNTNTEKKAMVRTRKFQMLQIDLEKERLCVVELIGEVDVKVAEVVGSWMTVEEQNCNLRNMEMRGVRVWQSRLKGQQQEKQCSTNGFK